MSLKDYLLSHNYIKIRFSISKTNHLVMKGKINNQTGLFILDTGASNTCIDSKDIDWFKLSAIDSETKASGAGSNTIDTQVAHHNRVKLGRWNHNNTDIILLDLTHVNQALKNYNTKPVNGIIGADILQNGDAVIDYANRLLYLKKQKSR